MLTIDYKYKNKSFQIQHELIECPVSLEISKIPVLSLGAHFQFLFECRISHFVNQVLCAIIMLR